MQKYGFVYIWYDKKHKRYYVGGHWGQENDGYICSSTWMMNAYKRRPQDFHKSNGKPNRRILERIYTNKKDTFFTEGKWLRLIKEEELRVKYYNMCRNTSVYWNDNIWLGKKHKEESKIKMSERKKEAWKNEEYRQHMSDAHLGKSPGNKGIFKPKKLCSIEDCKKIAEKRGWCQTHYRRWQRWGNPLVKKSNKGNKKPLRSEEHRCNLSKSNKGKIPWNKGKYKNNDGIWVIA